MTIIETVNVRIHLATGTLFYRDKDFGNSFDNYNELLKYLGYGLVNFGCTTKTLVTIEYQYEYIQVNIIY